jgi:hypothetical protein
MANLKREYIDGEGWKTVPNGGSQPGVWKDYGVDSTNPGLKVAGGVTVGDGTLTARWWTPAAVVASPATDPFLCVVYMELMFGSTTALTAFLPDLPTGVDGTGNVILPAGATPSNGAAPYWLASARIISVTFAGYCVGSSSVKSFDGTIWGAAVPGVWAEFDRISITATLQAVFYSD